MHSDNREPIWPIPLIQIEETMAAHLGPGRVTGNAAAPCFSRQVSMYLANHVCRWSLPKIGRFYNGRHHTTVLHAIAKIERLRTDEAFDSFLDILTETITSESKNSGPAASRSLAHSELIDAVAVHVIQHLKALPTNVGTEQFQGNRTGTFGATGLSARMTAYGTDTHRTRSLL